MLSRSKPSGLKSLRNLLARLEIPIESKNKLLPLNKPGASNPFLKGTVAKEVLNRGGAFGNFES
jgi:hypothetical protein